MESYLVYKNQTVKEVFQKFEENAQLGLPTGIVVLADNDKRVIGSITEGDIRRAILKGCSLDSKVEEIAQKKPILFEAGMTYKDILNELPRELETRGRKSKKYLGKIIIVNQDGTLSRVLDYHQLWEQRVATHRHVVVIGLGYVGLTLAMVLAEEGFLVTGVDADEKKINRLKSNNSYVFENGLPEILREQLGKNFIPTTNLPEDGDVFVISVGTPVSSIKPGESPAPNLKYIELVSEQVGSRLKQGNLVILRSTVPIGTCRNTVIPIIEKHSGLECGKDFHLAFAPERTAEGKALKELRSLPQIIGGFNEESVEATAALFRELTPTIVRVSSLEAAETVKLINNSFRDLIFAYANHVTQLISSFNIDVFEVINAANQGYPRDPVPLPSPGVGGPCLTKDPYIFARVAKDQPSKMTLFEHGRIANESMHSFLVERLETVLASVGKQLENSSVLICGLAFKGHPETGDIRNSSAVEIYHILENRVGQIYGHDPVAEQADIIEEGINFVDLYEGFKDVDAVLFLNNNRFYEKLDIFKMTRLLAEKPIILDGWSLFRADEILSIRPAIYMGLSHIKSSIE